MNHVLLGASIPFAIAALIYVMRGCRAGLVMLILTPLAMALLATWAVAPDLPRVLGFHGLYMRLYLDPRMDIFFWHYSIDQVETESRGYAVGIALEALALLAAAVREHFRDERT